MRSIFWGDMFLAFLVLLTTWVFWQMGCKDLHEQIRSWDSVSFKAKTNKHLGQTNQCGCCQNVHGCTGQRDRIGTSFHLGFSLGLPLSLWFIKIWSLVSANLHQFLTPLGIYFLPTDFPQSLIYCTLGPDFRRANHKPITSWPPCRHSQPSGLSVTTSPWCLSSIGRQVAAVAGCRPRSSFFSEPGAETGVSQTLCSIVQKLHLSSSAPQAIPNKANLLSARQA